MAIIKKYISKYKYQLFCLMVSFSMLLFTSKNSFLYTFNDWCDANAFFTVGKSIIHGLVPYKDLFEQKGPLLYFIYSFGYLISQKIPENGFDPVQLIFQHPEKTMNPKLGIIDGISVLGTTGIARSMSSEAYKNSIVTQIDVAIASSLNDLVFVPGNIGEKLALKRLDITKEQIIQTGNYVGFMFEEAKKRGIDKFTFFGHIGKLIKIAGGIFNTKHAVADGRREIMITHAALCGAEKDILEKLYDSATTDDMLDILTEIGLQKDVVNSIAAAIKQRCMLRFELDLDVILVDMEGNYLNDNMEGFL